MLALSSLAVALGVAAPAPAPAQQSARPCPPATAKLLASAWTAYRADSITVAAARFRQVVADCPLERDAQTGLGFALLRQGDADGAATLFDGVIAGDSTSVDGWEGRARVAMRARFRPRCMAAFRRCVSIAR